MLKILMEEAKLEAKKCEQSLADYLYVSMESPDLERNSYSNEIADFLKSKKVCQAIDDSHIKKYKNVASIKPNKKND